MDRAKARALGALQRTQNEWDYLIHRIATTPQTITDLHRCTFTEIATYVVHRMV